MTLNFNTDESGGSTVVLSGEAQFLKENPAALNVPPCPEKYRSGIDWISGSTEPAPSAERRTVQELAGPTGPRGGHRCPSPGDAHDQAPARRRAEAASDVMDVSDTELARRIIEEEQERLGVNGRGPDGEPIGACQEEAASPPTCKAA